VWLSELTRTRAGAACHWCGRPGTHARALRHDATINAPTQDEEDGGISDRPDDMVDVYHTFFGIAGLSLMGYEGLAAIDPTYALPVETVRALQRAAG
jgi:hypothetical protein